MSGLDLERERVQRGFGLFVIEREKERESNVGLFVCSRERWRETVR